jgi:uncharacterized protein (DUF3820 family)
MKPNGSAGEVRKRKRRSRRCRWRGEGDLKLRDSYSALVPYGRYGGWLLCRTPVDFLEWLAKTPNIDRRLKSLASELLALKGIADMQVSQGSPEAV